MKELKPQAWTLIIIGCCFVLSWLISFTSLIGHMETEFFRQLIELTPSINGSDQFNSSLPYGLQNLILITTFSLLGGYLIFFKKTEPTLIFVIQVVFSLFMFQLLLAVMTQFWLPTIWTIIAFTVTAFILIARAKFLLLKKQRPLSSAQNMLAIKQKINENNFEAAVYMLKNCEFSDEMFELAYDLGVKLEERENWILARYLYSWLVQFDPGIDDFVTRMDIKINPAMDDDLSTTEITGNKNQFGQYQLVGKKALGATATVYEAYDIFTHKRIALKILNQKKPKNSDNSNQLAEKPANENLDDRDVLSFLHEAMTVSRLDHPNIVKIHDADILDEQAYIAMDYIAGYPMSERLRRKNYLTAAESLRIMKSVLDALIVAHSKGVIHGDIKPANIMYDQNKKMYILTDFGAANNGSRIHENEKMIMGTPAYMSPEQLSGAKMDGRSDIFSLSVTIYHLLSGIQPFSGEKLSDLKKSILNQPVDTNLLSIPDIIKQVLEKGLQKKTYQRFADASQMLQAVIYCEKKLKETSNRQ